MERIVDHHIRLGPQKSFPLHESQHAYQRSRSCETALHDHVSRIEGALNRFNSMVMAGLNHGVDGTSTKWIDFMLKNRTVRFEVRGVSSVMRGPKRLSTGRSIVTAAVEYGNFVLKIMASWLKVSRMML
jgi:hypothetical protein